MLHRRRVAIVLAAVSGAIAIAGINAVPATVDLAQAKSLHASQVEKAYVTPAGSAVDTTRDGYTITVYTVVQWPIPSGSPISSPFGLRNAPCRGCSSDHKGTDYTPGVGYPVHVVADGTVSESVCSGGLGCHVNVEHVIDGVHVTSIYGHMQYNSITVSNGQRVKRGTVLGLVGDTGASTGNHLHFEIHVNGTPVDSNRWIHAHANI